MKFLLKLPQLYPFSLKNNCSIQSSNPAPTNISPKAQEIIMKCVVDAQTHNSGAKNPGNRRSICGHFDPSRVLSHMMSRSLTYSMNIPPVTPTDSLYLTLLTVKPRHSLRHQQANYVALLFILFIKSAMMLSYS